MVSHVLWVISTFVFRITQSKLNFLTLLGLFDCVYKGTRTFRNADNYEYLQINISERPNRLASSRMQLSDLQVLQATFHSSEQNHDFQVALLLAKSRYGCNLYTTDVIKITASELVGFYCLTFLHVLVVSSTVQLCQHS
jgi:hypothetical protein